jgi:hypothetical protein
MLSLVAVSAIMFFYCVKLMKLMKLMRHLYFTNEPPAQAKPVHESQQTASIELACGKFAKPLPLRVNTFPALLALRWANPSQRHLTQ